MMHTPLRGLINFIANRLPWSGQKRLHGAFALSMTEGAANWSKDWQWTVKFAGKSFPVPLRRNDLYLDWAAALTFLGHDIDEKQSYAAILRAVSKPNVFLDVGGNYGTHSLLMMAHGVEVFYFEPNPSCHGYFKAASARNEFKPHIEAVALGAAPGAITLRYPRNETWLGSTNAAVAETLDGADMVTKKVPMRTLDSYCAEIPPGRVVLKIDAEGSEMAILEGACELLATRRPTMLFESHRNLGERAALWSFMDASGYDITQHVWPQPALSRDVFLAIAHHNFLGVPRP